MCEFAAKEELKEKERQEKCDFCENPCGNDWCPVIKGKENDGN